MELSARTGLGEQPTPAAPGPHTPPAAIPSYQKPAKRKRAKKPGAKPGHAGHGRPRPESINRRVTHPAPKRCPDCGSRVHKSTRRRVRYIEDIPQVFPEVTEHTIPQQWCPACQKHVEPVVDEAMPKARFGHRLVVLTAWLHYGLGVTIAQVLAVLQCHLHFELSRGGVVNAWQRLVEVLTCWYDQIAEQVKASGVLHADETGWRVDGRSHWLWCFTTPHATYYMIDRCRGSPALNRFFTETFNGVLVTDFWAAYHAVECADRQMCLAHLLRELAAVDDRDPCDGWAQFSKKLRRLLHDGLRLKAQPDLSCEQRQHRAQLIHRRLMALVGWESDNRNVQRLVKRLRRHQDFLFAFLDYEDVPADNNHAEREIRPAVIMRKNSLCNRSEAGATAQAILMSVYRTLKLRGLDPLETIVDALKTSVRTGMLPPLPGSNVVLD